MPSGPVFNWLTVVHSGLQILDHALQYRTAQAARAGVIRTSKGRKRSPEPFEDVVNVEPEAETSEPGPSHVAFTQPSSLRHANEAWLRQLAIVPIPPIPSYSSSAEPAPRTWIKDAHTSSFLDHPSKELDVATNATPTVFSLNAESDSVPKESLKPLLDEKLPLHRGVLAEDEIVLDSEAPLRDALVSEPEQTRHLQSSKVPSSRIGRLFHYGGLAASLGYGAASELVRRSTSSSNSDAQPSSLMMTEANLTRLVSKLTQMRGAALKLGQFLSIQDTHVLPPELERVFRRVQDSAHYMPNWQMENVMSSSLGPAWRGAFDEFDPIPFAAASIGQVHRATLTASTSPTGAPARVAVKIQFPNIAESVASDLSYIRVLLSAGRLLPRGLFLDRTLNVMKEELADECNYTREAACMRAFGSTARLGDDARFKVPWAWEGSTERVLVMEHVNGTSVGGDGVGRLSQADRNEIAARVIELCLQELFMFREMQTDPNWSNFLWNAESRQIELVDFGATRSYSTEFIDDWLRLLSSAAQEDREACLRWSLKLGYLTGDENDIMNTAHVESLQLLATPFRARTQQPFGFGPDSEWATITADIRDRIPVMLHHRLTPPPRETYSLNRKLSGAFLLASRLRANVDCKTLWDRVVGNYRFSTDTT
ncbi:ABC1 family-domain-containing protein [Gloeopeniophorella convolvens]|nr:ABC1 family-domain-containing protein [Gloeopeniophorella convolvens]